MHRFDDIAKVDVGIVTGQISSFSFPTTLLKTTSSQSGPILCSGAEHCPGIITMIDNTRPMRPKEIRLIFLVP